MLEQHFGALIGWLKAAERLAERGEVEALRREEGRVTSIIADFGRDWKTSLDSINGQVLTSSSPSPLHLLLLTSSSSPPPHHHPLLARSSPPSPT